MTWTDLKEIDWPMVIIGGALCAGLVGLVLKLERLARGNSHKERP